MLRRTRLKTCMGCHSGNGINSIQTVINVGYDHFPAGNGPEVISKATSDGKRNHDSWKLLHALWRADSKK